MITYEHIMYDGFVIQALLAKLFTAIEMKTGIIFTIFKGGKKTKKIQIATGL